jgi:hypothetical protein
VLDKVTIRCIRAVAVDCSSEGGRRMFRVTQRDNALITVLIVVVCCFPSSAISQGVEAWSNLGLYRGQIFDIAIDPNNPDKMNDVVIRLQRSSYAVWKISPSLV